MFLKRYFCRSSYDDSDAPERRSTRRHSGEGSARVIMRGVDWSDSFELEIADASEMGLFLRTDFLFPLGEKFEIEVDSDREGATERRLAWVTRVVGGETPGLGLRFANLNNQRPLPASSLS